MKKRYIIIAVVVLIIGSCVYSKYQAYKTGDWSFQQGELVTITRGNLSIPIPATGTVVAARTTPIKSKASGKVIRVYFEPADRVKEGDLLVELDPVDEKRSVDSTSAELTVAGANLAIAESEAERVTANWPVAMDAALARLEATRAELQRALISFGQVDLVRQGGKAEDAKAWIASPQDVTPEVLFPRDDIRVQHCALQLALANSENAHAEALVSKGRAILASPSESYGSIRQSEYRDAVIALWQARANVLAACGDVRDAVNMHYLVNQAEHNAKVVNEALKQAQLRYDQARQRLAETKVHAPYDGIVQQVHVREGQIISSGITTVTGGTPVMDLADVSDLYVEADVDEADIGRVRELAPFERSAYLKPIGKNPATSTAPTPEHADEDVRLLKSPNEVKISVDAFREEPFTGLVDRVYPDPKVVNNVVSYGVRILLTSDNRYKLMIGMRASVNFKTSELQDVLLVDTEAIKVKNEEYGVYVPGDNNKPVFVPIKIGLSGPNQVQLKTDKLKEGDKVYTRLPVTKEDKDKEED